MRSALFVLPILASRTQAQSLDDFFLQRVFGETGLRVELWDEERTSANSDLSQKEIILREEFTLGTLGYFYHPRLLEFDLRATVGLQQQWTFVDGPQPDRSGNTTFPNWNLRARLFKENAYSGNIYSTRAENWTRQSFFPTVRSTVTETGANLLANRWGIPSSLHYHRYTFDSHGGSSQDQIRDNFLLQGSKFDDEGQFQYRLEYNDTEQPSNGLAFQDLNGRISSTKYFGPDKDLRWLNSASGRFQSGSVDNESLRANSQLFKNWEEDLRATGGVQYNRTESGSAFSETTRLTVAMNHQLYDSLGSGVSAEGSRTRVTGGDIDVQGGGAYVAYRRNTPAGRLGLRFEADYFVQDQEDLQGVVPVLDEAHQFTPGVPIILNSQAISPATVVVTDATGLITYSEGPDYILTTEGSRLRIDIPIGSLITSGDTILVDYIFAPNPAIEFSDFAKTSGLTFNFGEYADLNVSYATVDQDLISGTDSGILSQSRRTSAAFNVHPYGSTLGVHYENFDSEFAPFERLTYVGSYQRSFWRGSLVRLGAETFTTEFDGIAENERGTSASLSLSSNAAGSSILEFWAEWHKVNYRTDEGAGFAAEISWRRRIRALSISVRLRHVEENFTLASDQRVTSLFFTLLRSF